MTLASTGGRGVVDLLLLYCCLVEPLLLGGLLVADETVPPTGVEQCREWSSGPTTLREGTPACAISTQAKLWIYLHRDRTEEEFGKGWLY